jgi:hypothetical protein
MNLIEVLWKQDVDIGVPPLQALSETPPLGDAASTAAPDKPPHKPFVKVRKSKNFFCCWKKPRDLI